MDEKNNIKVKTMEESGLNRNTIIQAMRDCFEYSAATHPQIGIFWYDADNDDLVAKDKVDAENYEFEICSDGDRIRYFRRHHKERWEREKKLRDDKRFLGNYRLVPRGRVSQYEKKGFVVFVGDWIDNYPSVKDDIIYDFELPSDVKFIKDSHYNVGNE